MQKERLHINFAGFSLVEVILASAVFLMLVTAFAGAWLYGQESTVLAGNRAQAVLIAEEGLEAVRNIRDANFSELTDGTYGLSISGSQWILSGSSDTTGIFTRQIEISPISDDRMEIISTVTWQQNAQRDGLVILSTYLTNWQEERVVQPDCTGPPSNRPPECDEEDGGGGIPGGGPPDCTGPPSARPPECN